MIGCPFCGNEPFEKVVGGRFTVPSCCEQGEVWFDQGNETSFDPKIQRIMAAGHSIFAMREAIRLLRLSIEEEW